MKYTFKKGSRLPVKAQPAGQELNRICEKHGGELRPGDVVEESIPDTAPLHSCFTWDNGEAAEKWRLDEARYIIRSVAVVSESSASDEPVAIRAFVHRASAPTFVYEEIGRVMDDEEKRAEMIQQALRDLLSWRERYKQFTEFAGVIAAIDDIAS